MVDVIDLKDDLERIIIKNECHMKYPLILDRDPEYAAYSLTKNDCEVTLELMLSAFNSLVSFQKEYPLIEYNILYSATMFDWFVDFTYKLLKLVDEEKEWDVPYDFRPEKESPLAFFPPLIYKAYKKRAVERKFRSNIKSPIDKYRVIYISQMWDLEDFRGGFPAWYNLYETTIFEEYNPQTNTRVRVTFSRGEFRYFICGASDNWKEITDVPIEMDHVVSALLFRS